MRESSLGNVSVVQMARAVLSQASWVESREACAEGMRARIFLIGRLFRVHQLVHSEDPGRRKFDICCQLLWLSKDQARIHEANITYRCPMTPVLITRELFFSAPLHSSTTRPICTASSRPPFPVTALAQPELITTARIPSP